MARIAGVEIPRNKRIEIALTYIYGIGRTRAQEALEATGIDGSIRVKDLPETDVVKLREYVENKWKLEGELRSEVQANIKRLMDIGCYRGLRHRRGLRDHPHTYDLGEEWIRWTSLPFVFARWVLRNDLERQDALVIEDSLYTSLQDWADGLYRVSGPSDRVPVHPSEILTYTQGLRYFIGVPEEKSISLFQEYLEQLQQG